MHNAMLLSFAHCAPRAAQNPKPYQDTGKIFFTKQWLGNHLFAPMLQNWFGFGRLG